MGVHDETGIGTSGQLLASDLGGGEVMNPEPRRGHMLALLGFLSVLFLGFESGAQKGRFLLCGFLLPFVQSLLWLSETRKMVKPMETKPGYVDNRGLFYELLLETSPLVAEGWPCGFYKPHFSGSETLTNLAEVPQLVSGRVGPAIPAFLCSFRHSVIAPLILKKKKRDILTYLPPASYWYVLAHMGSLPSLPTKTLMISPSATRKASMFCMWCEEQS